MNALPVRRHPLTLTPDSLRVIIRSFIPSAPQSISNIIRRVLALSEDEVKREKHEFHNNFDGRHYDIEASLLEVFKKVQLHIPEKHQISYARKILIGAYFSGEYALESAALFNPSIVPHPNQEGLPEGSLHFVMSLRATGEGHISSIEFRTGTISSDCKINLDTASRFVAASKISINPRYLKNCFVLKLREMGYYNRHAESILEPLADEFTLSELNEIVGTVRHENQPSSHELTRTLECIQWLADSNYELSFPKELSMSERIIFPSTSNESNGIEDARFVRFVEDDGSEMYYATYTAFNGRAILPMLLETEDFLNFRVLTLNGNAVQNKGMALFPRRINGLYAMLSRQDDENILIMFSDNLHYWNDPEVLLRPAEPWESVKIGNCGSPIETEDGWLVITHGVGAMRKYCIGVALFDLDDPTIIIGRLTQPLLCAEGMEREGYVPNVVYSCGSLVHQGHLIVPYAASDRNTAFASVPLDALIAALRQGHVPE
ncbi:glycoside hydrolase family 130 protein [Pelagicoccus sp. SDUM812003]|uniref:glycoside hydrolase family 130 protein n=1 Tax=Pelagicoccus sp. SDUM812003 TaxID=3041267 RepID=UPI00281070DE|nr:glycoside hydrolase family 130 protein [Pelagicoccus sp. SDUM812003]MDQ8204740.1 glycoside hydrolase family 130 protein [Pelagicoccus sp. SDUM812003]